MCKYENIWPCTYYSLLNSRLAPRHTKGTLINYENRLYVRAYWVFGDDASCCFHGNKYFSIIYTSHNLPIIFDTRSEQVSFTLQKGSFYLIESSKLNRFCYEFLLCHLKIIFQIRKFQTPTYSTLDSTTALQLFSVFKLYSCLNCILYIKLLLNT